MKNPIAENKSASNESAAAGTHWVRVQQHRDRWSNYQGNESILRFSGKLSVKQLKSLPLFQDYPDAFLEEISPDISIAQWRGGAVLFEEGSYVDLMFYVIRGRLKASLLKGRENGDGANRPIFATRLGKAPVQDQPLVMDQTVFQQKISALEAAPEIAALSTVAFNLQAGETFQLKNGDIFGEIGALNGWPQSVTVQAETDSLLCQIRLPALRKMKQQSAQFKEKSDAIYRERFLAAQLRATPLLQDCDETLINQLKDRSELISLSPGKTLVTEGEAVDAFYLLRSGNLKVSQTIGSSFATVNYLSKGMTIGEVELLLEGMENWLWTITSVAYSELIKISRKDFRELMIQSPQIERRLWSDAVRRIKESGYSRKHLAQSELIQFSLRKGLVEGNSILLIDLETCVRCDDCVRGCAATHNGRPRFVREGEKFGNFLITRSCYHCEDPVCLIGCPTGAIRRANVGDVVEVNEQLCIGCSNCANKCPYDAIVMHETGSRWPENALPEHLRGRERKVASKCDLCYTSSEGPACVNNCPQGSAIRINNITEFQNLLGRD